MIQRYIFPALPLHTSSHQTSNSLLSFPSSLILKFCPYPGTIAHTSPSTFKLLQLVKSELFFQCLVKLFGLFFFPPIISAYSLQRWRARRGQWRSITCCISLVSIVSFFFDCFYFLFPSPAHIGHTMEYTTVPSFCIPNL